MTTHEQGATDAAGRPLGAISTLVSLFLLLLVFFIVLFSIASVQKNKAHDVVSSLDKAFGRLPSALGLVRVHDPAKDEDQTAKTFIDTVSELLTGALPTALAGTADTRLGTLLVVSLDPETLFEAGGDGVADPHRADLDRLAVLLQRSTAETGRFHLTIRAIAAADTPPGDGGEARMIRRLGGVADLLYRRGCPPDGVSILLDRGEKSGLQFEFRTLAGAVEP